MLLTLGGLGIWTIVNVVRSSEVAARYNLNLEYRYLLAAVERKRAELPEAA